MLLGKVGPTQLMLCAIMCVTSYGINYWICIYMLGAWDHVGGSCVIHIFGSFFGMGCTLLASQKGSAQNPDNAPRSVRIQCAHVCVGRAACMGTGRHTTSKLCHACSYSHARTLLSTQYKTYTHNHAYHEISVYTGKRRIVRHIGRQR
jgi:hypothetical protein